MSGLRPLLVSLRRSHWPWRVLTGTASSALCVFFKDSEVQKASAPGPLVSVADILPSRHVASQGHRSPSPRLVRCPSPPCSPRLARSALVSWLCPCVRVLWPPSLSAVTVLPSLLVPQTPGVASRSTDEWRRRRRQARWARPRGVTSGGLGGRQRPASGAAPPSPPLLPRDQRVGGGACLS